MTDINVLRAKYFLDETEAGPSEPVPQTYSGTKVTAMIDGQPYFDDLAAELDKVGTGAAPSANQGHFVYVAGWLLGLAGGIYKPAGIPSALFGSATPAVNADKRVPPLRLRTDDPPLIDVLKAKARAGVEVRVLGWISFAVMSHTVIAQLGGLAGIAELNAMTMETIKTLREEPAIGSRAMLNVISHSAGAVHSKMVVAGTPARAVAYTGGIDLVENRRAKPAHEGNQTWHDVMAKLEGQGVQGPHDWFGQMWNENLGRPVKDFRYEGAKMPSFLPGTPRCEDRIVPVLTPPAGEQHVQSLRTVPQFNYATLNCLPANEPISFAPKGIFEFRAVAIKALRAATSLVYIEDQSFWARETLAAVGEAVRAHAGLHVILLYSGAADPGDPGFPFAYLTNAINAGMLGNLTPAERQRVRLFRRLSPELLDPNIGVDVSAATPLAGSADRFTATTDLTQTGALKAEQLEPLNLFLVSSAGVPYPVVGNAEAAANTPISLLVEQVPGAASFAAGTFRLAQAAGMTVHSKLTIVDDELAIVGSANCMRRSLYTDLEHAVAVLDPGATPFAKRLRMELWAHHLGGTPGDYEDLQTSLHTWDPAWGTAGGRNRPRTVRNWHLPLQPDLKLEGKQLSKYDDYEDLDSRDSWGGLCP